MKASARSPVTPDPSPRSTIVGVVEQQAGAIPFRACAQAPVLDMLGGVPIVLVIGDDQKSIRVFERTLDGRTLELMAQPGVQPLRLLDAETGSEWDFSGRAISGPLAGRQLAKVKALKEYWFDWQIYQSTHGLRARGGTLPLRRSPKTLTACIFRCATRLRVRIQASSGRVTATCSALNLPP
jgi:hypothetical protein